MTLDELKEFNGKDGKKCYIAYKGKVYDISESGFWDSGVHMGRFEAGQDVTESINMSPHGEKNILKYPCVGSLDSGSDDNKNSKEKLQKLYAVLHPHPMTVHFPIALFIFAFLLQMGILLFKDIALILINAQALTFVFASIMTIPAILSGSASLYINYDWKTNKFLRRKIILSMLLLVLGILGDIIIYMVLSGSVTTDFKTYFNCYTAINVLAFITVSGIGYYGGKLTWGGKA